MNKIIVIGDIEGNVDCLTDAIATIRIRGSTPVVFLGDIYAPRDRDRSTEWIEQILKVSGVPITTYVRDGLDMVNVIRNAFETCFRVTGCDVYTSMNRFKGNVDVPINVIDNDFTFLFGNKEVDFLRDISTTRQANYVDGAFHCVFSYKCKEKKMDEAITLTLHQVNVLLTYLHRCRHVLTWKNVMLTHMYLNARHLIRHNRDHDKCLRPNPDILRVQHVITGHNRCYGTYIDHALPGINLHLLDVSHEDIRIIRNTYFISSVDNEIKIGYQPLDQRAHKLMRYRFNAQNTFLRGVFDDGKNVSTFEWYTLHTRRTSSHDEHKDNDQEDHHDDTNDDG